MRAVVEQRKSPNKVSVQFWVAPELRRNFTQVVAAEERTVAQDLRRYMAERVADARDENGELKAAA